MTGNGNTYESCMRERDGLEIWGMKILQADICLWLTQSDGMIQNPSLFSFQYCCFGWNCDKNCRRRWWRNYSISSLSLFRIGHDTMTVLLLGNSHPYLSTVSSSSSSFIISEPSFFGTLRSYYIHAKIPYSINYFKKLQR